MTEAIFPLLGTAFVVLIVLPLSALVAKAGLVMLERDEVGGPLHGLNLRYVLLTGSSVLPLTWFLSAGLHQVETGKSALACLFDHDKAKLCFEPGFFALLLAISVLAAALGVMRRHRAARVSSSDAALALRNRIARIAVSDLALASLRDRVVVTEDPDYVLGTHGLLRPRVFIAMTFAERLSDEMLGSALAHEAEHVRALDPLRYLILQLALAVNPLGRFVLTTHAARWQAAREAHCDREAVIHGAAPLPLADAIVMAARPTPREAVALGPRDTAVLKFRIGMLLAFAERAPSRCCHRGPAAIPVGFFLLVIALLLPHQTGTRALDALHTGVEQAANALLALE